MQLMFIYLVHFSIVVSNSSRYIFLKCVFFNYVPINSRRVEWVTRTNITQIGNRATRRLHNFRNSNYVCVNIEFKNYFKVAAQLFVITLRLKIKS